MFKYVASMLTMWAILTTSVISAPSPLPKDAHRWLIGKWDIEWNEMCRNKQPYHLEMLASGDYLLIGNEGQWVGKWELKGNVLQMTDGLCVEDGSIVDTEEYNFIVCPPQREAIGEKATIRFLCKGKQ